MQIVGANKVITPTSIGGMRMASEMVRPTVTNFLDEMLRDKNKNLRIEELALPSSFAGKSLADVPVDGLDQTLVLAIKEPGGWQYVPSKNHAIVPESRLVLMTCPEELRTLENRLR